MTSSNLRKYNRFFLGMVILFGMLALLHPRSLKSKSMQQQFNPAQTVAALLQTRSALVATITAIENASTPGSSTPTPTATSQKTNFGIVTVRIQGLNIRSGPGTGYAVINNASNGQKYSILGQSNDCAWLKIGALDAAAREIGWISGAAQYSSYTVSCREIPTARP